MNTGCPRAPVHDAALQLLQLLDQRFFGNVGPLPATELEAGKLIIYIFVFMHCNIMSVHYTSFSLINTYLLSYLKPTFYCIIILYSLKAFATPESFFVARCRQNAVASLDYICA